MYFSSKKGKWYNWAVQMRPLYRYVITATMMSIGLIAWRWGLYAYLEEQINFNQAAIKNMNQQLIQLAKAERMCTDLSCKLPSIKEKIACYKSRCCMPGFCQKQIETVIDYANKSHLALHSYGQDSQQSTDWCRCTNVQFMFEGSLSSIMLFFSLLQQSKAMIECEQFSCQRVEENRYSVSCKLSFIAAE